MSTSLDEFVLDVDELLIERIDHLLYGGDALLGATTLRDSVWYWPHSDASFGLCRCR